MLALTKQLQEVHKSLPLSPVRKPTTAKYYQLNKIKTDINNIGVIVDCQRSSVQSVKERDKKTVVTVLVKDISGRFLSDAANFISIQAVPKDSVKATMDNIGGGSYMVSFNSKQSGDHSITITVAGESVSYSQFICQLTQENVNQETINCNTGSKISIEDNFDLFGDNYSANDGWLLATENNYPGTSLFVKDDDADFVIMMMMILLMMTMILLMMMMMMMMMHFIIDTFHKGVDNSGMLLVAIMYSNPIKNT